jgi:hypothetical protein
MKSAHRSYRSLNRRERSDDWPFSRCLRLAHAEIAGKRDHYAVAQLEQEMRRLVDEDSRTGPRGQYPPCLTTGRFGRRGAVDEDSSIAAVGDGNPAKTAALAKLRDPPA